jgi:hypothetical protein
MTGTELRDPGLIRSLILIYNADWGVAGGVDYLLGLLRGASDCALCDITHRGVLEKRQWRSCRAALGVPVEGRYRNRLDPALAAACGRKYPAVLARTGDAIVPLLGPGDIAACAGDVAALQERLRESAAGRGLVWA